MNFSSVFFFHKIVIVLFAITILVLLVPTISLIVRRLHDTERKGTLVLLSLVPFVLGLIMVVVSMFKMSSAVAIATPGNIMAGTAGIMSLLFVIILIPLVLTIIWCSMPGTEGPNKYGPDPNVQRCSPK